MQRAKTVDDYIRNANAWQDELIMLRLMGTFLI